MLSRTNCDGDDDVDVDVDADPSLSSSSSLGPPQLRLSLECSPSDPQPSAFETLEVVSNARIVEVMQTMEEGR